MQVLVNTGMMTVVPAWKIREMFDQGPLVEGGEEIVKTLFKRYGSLLPRVAE